MTKKSPSENRPSKGSRNAAILVLLLGLGIGLGWLFVAPENPRDSHAPLRTVAPKASSSLGVAGEAAPAREEPSTDVTLQEGQQAVIELEDWPGAQPLIVDLALAGEADSDFGIKSAWIYQENKDPLQIETQRSGPRGFRAELPLDALSPGRAIIELRTDEKKRFALRRFAVQIR